MTKKLFVQKSASPIAVDPKNAPAQWLTVSLSFILPIFLVAGLLYLLVSFRGGVEAGIANFVTLLPIGYAFAAGMVASANPCGLLMLPSYVFAQLKPGEQETDSLKHRLWKGLKLTFSVTAGFLVVFSVVGLLVSLGSQWIIGTFSAVGIVIGVLMTALGIWILVSNRTFGISALEKLNKQQTSGALGGFLFGMAYALGSLSCTLPIFLVVVATSLTRQGVAGATGQFIAYAAGMGLIIFVVTLGAALFRRLLAKWLRAITPFIHKLSAFFLIGAGLYLLYYWLVEARLLG